MKQVLRYRIIFRECVKPEVTYVTNKKSKSVVKLKKMRIEIQIKGTKLTKINDNDYKFRSIVYTSAFYK